MPTDKRTITWYNDNAAVYTRHVRTPDESIYHSLYEKPAMYHSLPDIKGKDVISLGCGSGEDCHYLARRGAAKVVGIDISVGLVGVAKESYPECEFAVMDMERLDFPNNSFDFAYSSLAFHYLEDWSAAFKEAYRVLRSGSYLLLSCGHPVYSALQVTEDSKEVKTEILSHTIHKHTGEATVVGDYLTRRPIRHTRNDWLTWHKPVSEIVGEAARAGFVVADLIEPAPLLSMQKIAPNDYDLLRKIPNFMILKLRKL